MTLLLALGAFVAGCSAILGLDDRVPSSSSTAPLPDSSSDAMTVEDASDERPRAVCGGVTCKAHEVCGDAGGCVCVGGYVLSAGSCIFRGGPRDPSFENMPVAWTVEDGGSLAPLAQGANGLGTASATYTSSISQSFDMPDFLDAEPLALNLVSRRPPCGGNPICVPPLKASLSFGPGDISAGPADTAFITSRICLGDLAYGRDTKLVLRGGQMGTIFDRADYVPDATCPAPGTVRNGDFSAFSGWTGTGGALIADGVGTAGSRAGKLSSPGCPMDFASASLAGEVSVPKDMKSPALRFAHRGSGGRRLQVNGASVRETPSFTTDTVCVPRSSKGYAFPVLISAENGSCGAYEAVVDDVTLVTSPSCGEGYFFDGGFEGEPSHWIMSATRDVGISARVTSQQFIARTGASALELSGAVGCASGRTTAEQSITVPQSVGAAGPAVFFWYSSGASLFSVNDTIQPLSGPYSRAKVCLPPSRAGRSLPLVFALNASAGDCSTVRVDDVELGNDLGCPAN